MTKYVIRSSESLGTPNVYGWSEDNGGEIRCDHLQEFPTALAAAWALAAIPQHLVTWYCLEVAPASPPAPAYSHGWMVRHPSFDLMH